MPVPTRGRTGGIVFRIDFSISSGCWRTAREEGAYFLEELVALEREPPFGPTIRGSVIISFYVIRT